MPLSNILNRFDVFTQIFVTPPDILLSQKIYASLNRKTPKGRDFFDILFLIPLTKPNYEYLDFKLHINNPKSLKLKLLNSTEKIDFSHLTKDVSPFLINKSDERKILLFRDYIKEIEF